MYSINFGSFDDNQNFNWEEIRKIMLGVDDVREAFAVDLEDITFDTRQEAKEMLQKIKPFADTNIIKVIESGFHQQLKELDGKTIAKFEERLVKLRVNIEDLKISIVQTQPDKIHDGMVWKQDWYDVIDISENIEEVIKSLKKSIEAIYNANDELDNIKFVM